MKKASRRKEDKMIVAEHLKLIASQVRLIEMHCEVLIPCVENSNTQGSIRDALRSIARSYVTIAEVLER